MTKVILSILFFALLGLSTGAQAQTPAENQKTLLRMTREIFSQGKLEVIDEIFASSFTDHNPPGPGLPAGKEGARAVVSMFRAAFPDLHFDQLDAVTEGNKIAQRWRMSGTMQGTFMGNAPTGKRFSIEGLDIIYFNAAGKITDRWGQLDVMSMLTQLGLLPPPPEGKH